MVSLEPILSAAQRIEPHSPLTRAQNVHVWCGYHSLSVYAAKILACAPSFRRGMGCTSHADCTKLNNSDEPPGYRYPSADEGCGDGPGQGPPDRTRHVRRVSDKCVT
ncbi:hypothetical protein BDZ89DRAFT_1200395 [Hymenopellis radicata]|nr:hypothetical protein BDZ89DRAFT_1200395 [Hymenopellis radicata]